MPEEAGNAIPPTDARQYSAKEHLPNWPTTQGLCSKQELHQLILMMLDRALSLKMSALDTINPSLTRYGRQDPAPVLPLREEPDLLTWLEASGRLVADEESGSPEVSTVEEEELSALMGEKEDYNNSDEQNEEEWED